jgi:ceramide glucosyltransferase
MYKFLNFIAVDSCVNGKSNMYRKSVLESLGGLSYFGKYLAEDNVIGQAVMRKGFKHAMTPDLALQPLGNMSLTTYLKRRIRWIRVRKYTVSVGTLYEPFTECLLSGLIGSRAFYYYFNTPPLLFIAYHIAFWLLCDTLVTARLESGLYRPWAYLFAWTLKEIGAIPLWIMAMLGTTVVWRGQPYHLNPDGTVSDGSKIEPSRWRLVIDGWMDWSHGERTKDSTSGVKRRSTRSNASSHRNPSPRRSGRVSSSTKDK